MVDMNLTQTGLPAPASPTGPPVPAAPITGLQAGSYEYRIEMNDGCTYTYTRVLVCSGCTDPSATNYCNNATMDDGSCLYPASCEVIIKDCNSSVYYSAYACYDQECALCHQTPLNCDQSQAIITNWGWQNYGDVTHIDYNGAIDPNQCTDSGHLTQLRCFQWIDPNDPDYQQWLNAGNTLHDLVLPQQWLLQANHAPGLNLTYIPYDGVSYTSTCATCQATQA